MAAHLRAAAPAEIEGDKGRVTLSKVYRYRADKLPAAFLGSDPASEDEAQARFGALPFGDANAGSAEQHQAVPALLLKKSDPRLARLARTDVEGARVEGLARHRRERHAAEVVKRAEAPGAARELASRHERGPVIVSSAEAAEGKDDAAGAQVEDVAEARQARRERALRAQREAEAAATAAATEAAALSDDESGDSSEYETESSDEDAGEGGRLAKPLFVQRAERETIAEREAAEAEAALQRDADAARAAERAKETSSLVAAVVDAERAAAAAARGAADGAMVAASDVDTATDEDDDDAAFEAWKRRELARVKREEAARDPVAAAAAARGQEGAPQVRAERGKLKFLQKYYHRGAFYQSAADDERGTAGGDAIYTRDYTGATGEDRFDKEALPAVMQVKNFGRAGRTKWKHLAAEDTTFAGMPQRGDAAGQSAYGGVADAYGSGHGAYGDFGGGGGQHVGYNGGGVPEDVFARIKQAADAKGGGRTGRLGGDEFAKPKSYRT